MFAYRRDWDVAVLSSVFPKRWRVVVHLRLLLAEFAAFPMKIESVKMKLYHYFPAIGKLPITNLLTNLRILKTMLTLFYVEQLSSQETNARSTWRYVPNIAQNLASGGFSTQCRVPEGISNHGKGKGTWPKGERLLGKEECEMILRKTGLVVQVRSGRFLFFIKYTLWFHMVMLASVDGSFFGGAKRAAKPREEWRRGNE